MEIIIAIAVIGGAIFLIGKILAEDNQVIDRRDHKTTHKTPPQYRSVAKKVAPIKAATPRTQHALKLPPFPDTMTIKGKAYVIDGDTIRIESTKIRLAGIDAPEVDEP